MLPEREHFVSEFVKTKSKEIATKKDSSVQTTLKTSSTVQFYDHVNKFSSEYEGNLDLEERLLNIIPLNAWDEAKQEICRNTAIGSRICTKFVCFSGKSWNQHASMT